MVDREKGIEGLKIVWNAFNYMKHDLYADYVLDAIELLIGQEAVRPTWSRGKPYCGSCGLRIRGGKYCSECGAQIAWEGGEANERIYRIDACGRSSCAGADQVPGLPKCGGLR